MNSVTRRDLDNEAEGARRWWSGLRGGEGGPVDRAALAMLRRCRAPVDAWGVPAFHELRGALAAADPDRLAVLAIVLAHVKEDVPGGRVAALLGGVGEARPRMTELRFRRLLLVRSEDEMIVVFARMVHLLGGRVPVRDLSRAILAWERDGIRQRWAFAYFDAADAAPASTVAETA